MLSLNELGQHGRFANQIFQYAALFSIAKKHNYNFCIPPSTAQSEWTDHKLFQAFDLPSLHVVGWQRNVPQIKESSFAYDENLVNSCPDNVDLVGYFQTERYFVDNPDIRSELKFKDEFLTPCQNYIKQHNQSIIALHVRRTDYISKSVDHPPCSLDYYQQALEIMPKNLPVIIFSDDIEWCKRQPIFQGPRWIYSQGNNNIVDLCLMSLCSHFIIANSSYSWMGAWLSTNQSKIIIAPKKWFGSGPMSYTKNNDTSDLVPKSWITI
jgi:hypothetical protein